MMKESAKRVLFTVKVQDIPFLRYRQFPRSKKCERAIATLELKQIGQLPLGSEHQRIEWPYGCQQGVRNESQ